MNGLLELNRHKTWLVSGTPFPSGDVSVRGINLMLGVNLKFVISNSPFTKRNTQLAPDHPFEVMKRRCYIRNTPTSVGDEIRGSGEIVEAQPYDVTVHRLVLLPIERAFIAKISSGVCRQRILPGRRCGGASGGGSWRRCR